LQESAPIKLIKKISTTKGSLEKGLCIVEGWKCFGEALQKETCSDVIIIDHLKTQFENEFKHYQGNIHSLDEKTFKLLSHLKSPEGIIGIFKRPKLYDVLPTPEKGSLHLGLYNWNDPNNIGAITRTARGLDISSITLFGNGPDFYSAKVIRTSMGSVFYINLHTLKEEYCNLDNQLWNVYAASAEGEDSSNLTLPQDKANMLMIGSESHGFDGNPPNNAKMIRIDLKNDLESLSAPIAASILIDRLKCRPAL
jgi:RNA methyltransferase, TrmH family